MVSGPLVFLQGKATGTQKDQELLNQIHPRSNSGPTIYQQSGPRKVNGHICRQQRGICTDPREKLPGSEPWLSCLPAGSS